MHECAGGDARMKTSVLIVSASLTLAIILVAGFLIATQARVRDSQDHLWKMKNAPAAIKAKPMAWFQPSGSFRYRTEKPANTASVMTS